jgi:plasmid maintenance system antidote protein VapI
MRRKKGCEPLVRYCEIHGLSRAELADKLGYPPPTVRSWVNGHRPISAETAIHVEKMIGIPRETLRPDLFVRRAA